jgi:hypothetical protein
MKKKHRDIVVNGKKFAWTTTGFNCDGDGSFNLRIWFNKQEIYHELVGGIQVTPKYVRNIIDILNK